MFSCRLLTATTSIRTRIVSTRSILVPISSTTNLRSLRTDNGGVGSHHNLVGIGQQRSEYNSLNFPSKNRRGLANMADSRIVNYDDVVSFEKNPKVMIVDVREPKELQDTGRIPSSVNIPLGEVEAALSTVSGSDFKSKYGRDQPGKDMELVFSCKMGGRATKAMNAALALGYENSKVYKGSWDDWASRQ